MSRRNYGEKGVTCCFLAACVAVLNGSLGISTRLQAQCEQSQYTETDDFFLEAQSASGAVGDVVGVQVLFHSRVVNVGWVSLYLAICHDPEVAELVGAPSFTDEYISLLGPGGAQSYRVDDTLAFHHKGDGVLVNSDFDRFAYSARLPSDTPVPMMTLYYRIKGTPGRTGTVSFCDGVLERANATCNFNYMYTYNFEGSFNYLSTHDVSATLTVLEGPATHPDRPPEPPKAKIYPEVPTDSAVNFRVRITGANAAPGNHGVPVEVYVSSDFEYTGISVPIDFDERYLRVSRAEDHFLAGVTLVDNHSESPGADAEEGHVVIFSGFGVNSYRLAAEGEEVHAATIYFDVLDTAEEISETTLEVNPVTDSRGVGYGAWIGVQHQNGTNTGDPIVRSEIAPIDISGGLIKLKPEPVLFIRGDSNGDNQVRISDAIKTLGYLFLGSAPPSCFDAADANDDGELDIGDPVTTLGFLFLGGVVIPPPNGTPGPDPTADSMTCFSRGA